MAHLKIKLIVNRKISHKQKRRSASYKDSNPIAWSYRIARAKNSGARRSADKKKQHCTGGNNFFHHALQNKVNG